ncbi:hypothetical protein ACTXT7_001279 [Hymenolepis weldensis]
MWKSLGGSKLEPISLSEITFQQELNLISGLDWLGQLDLLDLPTNGVCYRVHSATSTTSFTAEMMGQCFSEAFQGHGLCLNAELESNRFLLTVPDDIEVARELLTEVMHRGLYQCTRLRLGIKIKSAIFQQIMDTMTSGLFGCILDENGRRPDPEKLRGITNAMVYNITLPPEPHQLLQHTA